jgi:hypothetical protein
MRSPLPRAAVALLLFSAWLALLFAGYAGGGAVHLLLAAALALFPWRALRADPSPARVGAELASARGGGDSAADEREEDERGSPSERAEASSAPTHAG